MDIALCYESVLPARGGAETYIGDLARRLARDGHAVHLYASPVGRRALPAGHALPPPRGAERAAVPAAVAVRRPRANWRSQHAHHDVSVGFDKTWGQDVLYPQGGLHAASAAHNLLKFSDGFARGIAALGKWLDPAAWSFARLERKQYLGPTRPLVVVNSLMVRKHFEQFYGVPPEAVRVVRSAIDPHAVRRRRPPEAAARGARPVEVFPEETVGLFVAMNYRLKGLAPLLERARATSRARSRSDSRWSATRSTAATDGRRRSSASRTACGSSATATTRRTATSPPTSSSTRPSTTRVRWSRWKRWRAGCRSSRRSTTGRASC